MRGIKVVGLRRGDNRTPVSRVSFDFRVIRLRDFGWSQVPPPGDARSSQVRWSTLESGWLVRVRERCSLP